MRILLRPAALGLGSLAFVVGAGTAIGGRVGKVEESVPLAVVDQTDKLAAVGVMLAGVVLLAGGVIAGQLPTRRTGRDRHESLGLTSGDGVVRRRPVAGPVGRGF